MRTTKKIHEMKRCFGCLSKFKHDISFCFYQMSFLVMKSCGRHVGATHQTYLPSRRRTAAHVTRRRSPPISRILSFQRDHIGVCTAHTNMVPLKGKCPWNRGTRTTKHMCCSTPLAWTDKPGGLRRQAFQEQKGADAGLIYKAAARKRTLNAQFLIFNNKKPKSSNIFFFTDAAKHCSYFELNVSKHSMTNRMKKNKNLCKTRALRKRNYLSFCQIWTECFFAAGKMSLHA